MVQLVGMLAADNNCALQDALFAWKALSCLEAIGAQHQKPAVASSRDFREAKDKVGSVCGKAATVELKPCNIIIGIRTLDTTDLLMSYVLWEMLLLRNYYERLVVLIK